MMQLIGQTNDRTFSFSFWLHTRSRHTTISLEEKQIKYDVKHGNVMDLMIKITGRNILIKDNVSVSS